MYFYAIKASKHREKRKNRIQKYSFFRGMRLKGLKSPKFRRWRAVDGFTLAVAFRSLFAVFIVKANKKFSNCKLLQKEAKIMRARAWFRAPALVRV